MELIKIKALIRCDMPMCSSRASYAISAKNGFKSRQINICPTCLAELYRAIASELVPKSPLNLIVKAVKRREEDAK